MQVTYSNFIKNFPNEVFLGVLEKLGSEDIQNFALTCKENYFLVYGAKLNKTSELFHYLIISKIKQGETNKVAELIEDVGIDISYKQHKIFRKIIKYNQADILKRFLKEKKINPLSYRKELKKGFKEEEGKILDHWGLDPIIMSSIEGYTEIVKILLKDGRITENLDIALQQASMSGHIEIVKMLLQSESFVELAWFDSAIKSAAENGHFEVVIELAKDRRVNPSIFDNNVLRLAIKNNHFETVELLLKDNRVKELFSPMEYRLLKQIFLPIEKAKKFVQDFFIQMYQTINL